MVVDALGYASLPGLYPGPDRVDIGADRRLRAVLEPYMALLERSKVPNAAEESLRIADAKVVSATLLVAVQEWS
jgi:hypothetical protein